MNQGLNDTTKLNKSQQLADAALDRLSKALEAGHSEALKAWLVATSRFHRYSWTNVMLIEFQKPNATHVAGFNTWRTQFKRFVKKGENGIMIMAPVTLRIGNAKEQRDAGTVESKDIHRIVNVKPVYVFDVSQTEGEPLPEFAKVTGEPAHYIERLKAFIQSRGIVLEYADALSGAMGTSYGGRIRILSGQTGPAEFSVLAHEYAHEALHRGERRHQTSKTIRETEAEAVAYVVCQTIGLETSTASSDYIQLYRGDKDTLAESLQYVRNVSAEIISALELSGSGSFEGPTNQDR